MSKGLRYFPACVPMFFFCLVPLRLAAASWQQPTPEELSMTSVPGSPGAPAVYLLRDEQDDDKFHFEHVYVRLKVLTEDGKKYADVEMPVYDRDVYSIGSVQGRTIHSDGTIIPFTGKPIDKLLMKSGDLQYHTKVFSLPDVQVGSILEYRYDINYDESFVLAPDWKIQQEIPLLSGHYHFTPWVRELVDEHGVETQGQTWYSSQLPHGTSVVYSPGPNVFDVNVEKLPAIPEEDFMPPLQSLTYGVDFYYSAVSKAEEYWRDEGRYWSRDVDKFASPSRKIQDAVQQIVQPSDPEQLKVSKIYDAVMQLENTSFTREHSTQEDKAQGIRIKNAQDIWEQKRGNDDEITLLFIAMARAAGFKAYAMRVANRDVRIFRPNFLSMSQLDDDIAIVVLDGKEHFFDPGQRYCGFGQMHWKHTLTEGIRQSEQGVVLAESPPAGYKDSSVVRTADLSLSPAGQVTGTLRIIMNGTDALKWRQAALTSDEEEVKKDYQEDLQKTLPAGVEVKTNHFIGLADWRTLLMVSLDVSGSLGTATSKRLFLPSTFFEASAKPLFSHEKREMPIDLGFAYQMVDNVTIKLPPTSLAESVPKDSELSLPKRAVYGVKYKADGNVYTASRQLILAAILFDPTEYPEVRDFYQKMNAQDQQQLILKTASASGSGQ